MEEREEESDDDGELHEAAILNALERDKRLREQFNTPPASPVSPATAASSKSPNGENINDETIAPASPAASTNGENIDDETIEVLREYAAQFRSLRHYDPAGYSESFIRKLLAHSKHHSCSLDEFRGMLECEYTLRRKKHEDEVLVISPLKR